MYLEYNLRSYLIRNKKEYQEEYFLEASKRENGKKLPKNNCI